MDLWASHRSPPGTSTHLHPSPLTSLVATCIFKLNAFPGGFPVRASVFSFLECHCVKYTSEFSLQFLRERRGLCRPLCSRCRASLFPVRIVCAWRWRAEESEEAGDHSQVPQVNLQPRWPHRPLGCDPNRSTHNYSVSWLTMYCKQTAGGFTKRWAISPSQAGSHRLTLSQSDESDDAVNKVFLPLKFERFRFSHQPNKQSPVIF